MGIRPEDIDASLTELNETFDIDRDDLDRILRRVEFQSLVRMRGDLKCEDIMSRDVVSIPAGTSSDEARALLLYHHVRTLPMIGNGGRLGSVVGLRELASMPGTLPLVASPADIATAGEPALSLLPVLTGGRSHAVVIVDEGSHVVGMITQTDLLAASAKLLRHSDAQTA